jgi:hypothetical protein
MIFSLQFSALVRFLLYSSQRDYIGAPRDGTRKKEEDTTMKRNLTRTKGLIRRISSMVAPSLLVATVAVADTGEAAGGGGMSPLMVAFLIFIAVIIGIQLIPAMVIFGSLITAVFKRSKRATKDATINEQV